jgi:hypothetical protein
MNISWSKVGTALALVTALVWAPVAMAAQGPAQGDTSGPAVGSPPTPSAAVQKHTSSQTGAASGAPGVEAKSGTESGAAPKAPAPAKQSASHQ